MGKNTVIEAAIADWGFQPSRAWEPIVAAEVEDVAPVEELRWHLPEICSALLEYIERREGIQLEEETRVDVAVMPGSNLTLELLSRETGKRMLRSLVERMYRAPLSWEIEKPAGLVEDTMLAALAFIDLLPDNVSLPRIAPDGEGGLTLRWDTGNDRSHLLGIDSWRLHFVFNAGRHDALYLEDVRFTGQTIPDEIRDRLT